MALDPASWAMIGSAVIGAGSSIFGANKASDAMQSSSAAQNALAQQIYGQQRADQQPYMQSGYQALNALNRLYGLGQVSTDTSDYGSLAGAGTGLRPTPLRNKKRTIYVDKDGYGYTQAQYGENKGEWIATGQQYKQYALPAKPAAPVQPTTPAQTEQDRYGGFYASPGYQFRLDEGGRALDRSAAARGMLLSGAQNKALTRYGQGVASSEFNQYANALRNIAGLGQVANSEVANAASNYGANAGNALMQQGMARASGYLGTAGTIGSIANNVMASIPYWRSNNAAPSQQAGYAAPGTGGFMPIANPFFAGR